MCIKVKTICIDCVNARRAASQELEEEGYVGCKMFALKSRDSRDYEDDKDVSFIKEAKELYEGWVDLRAKPFGKPSGVTTNLQLLTLGVTKCDKFEKNGQ